MIEGTVVDPLHIDLTAGAGDAADLALEARRLLAELDRDVPGAGLLNAECRPPLDIVETATSLEIVIDIPGVAPDAVRVSLRRGTLLLVGAKVSPPPDTGARFHLAERSYGRFARAVRLTGAVNAAGAHATVSGGQLRVVLPRLEDRRGQIFRIPVSPA
jgi:HSP20 family protein